MPAAENSASFHFEIDAPKGVEIAEASPLAGRPVLSADPSLDHMYGAASRPSACMSVEVPNGSLSRAHIALQVVTRGLADGLHAVILGSVRAAAGIRDA